MNAVERIEPPVQSNSGSLMAIIDRAVSSQNLDVDKLQKLLEMKERWDATEARKEFEAAISLAKSEIKPIAKKRKVDFTTQKGRTHYQYEDLALVAEEVDPILGKYGLSYRYRSQQNNKELTVTCIVSHRAGHSEETTLKADNDESGNKNTIQGIGSAATYLQRYTLKLALGLSAAKDNDGAGQKPEEPEGYDKWAADMEAVADEGIDRLQAVWKTSGGAFKNYVTKHDVKWWEDLKAKAQKVKS